VSTLLLEARGAGTQCQMQVAVQVGVGPGQVRKATVL
jgi:hypothetical protein